VTVFTRLTWLAFGGLVISRALAASPSPRFIHGRVTDGSGDPIDAVDVTIVSTQGASVRLQTRTSPDGKYEFKFDSAGTVFKIWFEKADLPFVTAVCVVDPTGTGRADIILHDSWFRRLQNQGFQLRKALDGTLDESRPAEIGWANDRVTHREFWNINAAARITNWAPWRRERKGHQTSEPLIISPIVEWHHFALGSTTTRKLSAKLNAVYQPFGLDPLTPVVIVSGQYVRDFEQRKWATSVSSLLSIRGERQLLPGSHWRPLQGQADVLYYPYVGYEYYAKLPTVTGEPVSLAMSRLSAEVDLFGRRNPQAQILQVVLTWTYRRRLTAREGIPRNPGLLTAGLTYCVTQACNVGVGYDYQHGESPLDDFKFSERSSIGLRLKL
jgi:hypothetical protein